MPIFPKEHDFVVSIKDLRHAMPRTHWIWTRAFGRYEVAFTWDHWDGMDFGDLRAWLEWKKSCIEGLIDDFV